MDVWSRKEIKGRIVKNLCLPNKSYICYQKQIATNKCKQKTVHSNLYSAYRKILPKNLYGNPNKAQNNPNGKQRDITFQITP